jgi:hypothetical protein
MKTSELKQIIKESVKEAIQDELKNILLEALKSNNRNINENKEFSFTTSNIEPRKTVTESENNSRNKYNQMVNPNEYRPVNPEMAINGALPPGEISLEQIMSVMGKK